MEKSLYSYEDWHEGKVYLDTCAVIFDPLTEKPIKVTLVHFSKKDSSKIEQMQKKIFLQEANEKLKLFKSIFNDRYRNSEAKNLLIDREIYDNKHLLFSKPNGELIFKNRAFRIDENDHIKMNSFINSHIVKGEPEYSFVHSPHFKHQYKKEVDTLIYARATFDYYKWLMNFKKVKEKLLTAKEGIIKTKQKTNEKLPVKVIALIYFYKKVPITKMNCQKYAEKYGYVSKTSGDGLLHDYYKFSDRQGRIGINDESKTQCKNRLKLINLAINQLKGEAKKRAKNDYQILDKLIDEHNW